MVPLSANRPTSDELENSHCARVASWKMEDKFLLIKWWSARRTLNYVQQKCKITFIWIFFSMLFRMIFTLCLVPHTSGLMIWTNGLDKIDFRVNCSIINSKLLSIVFGFGMSRASVNNFLRLRFDFFLFDLCWFRANEANDGTLAAR